jgi:DedD protein
MRSLLDAEDVEDKAPEITLSTVSVLGIFFALVLVCGVFFGFGYSMGRGTEMGTQVIKIQGAPAPALNKADQPETAENTPPPAPQQTVRDEAPAPLEEPPATPAQAKPASEPVITETPNEGAARRQAGKKPSPVLQAAMMNQPANIAANMNAPSGTGQPVVQIAAVARREDADVLVSALKQRGYGVNVRSEPQDNLLHVQVGPFSDRSQAAAMKQKLMADGYNAIIKQ